MKWRPQKYKRTYPLFPYPTHFRSHRPRRLGRQISLIWQSTWKKAPGRGFPGPFSRACVTSKRSDLVAERALALALQIMGFALALLPRAFGAKELVIGRLAGRLLRLVRRSVGGAR